MFGSEVNAKSALVVSELPSKGNPDDVVVSSHHAVSSAALSRYLVPLSPRRHSKPNPNRNVRRFAFVLICLPGFTIIVYTRFLIIILLSYGTITLFLLSHLISHKCTQ